ncbi:cyclin-dependent kinase 4 inhibitor B-like [Acipenser oxyrinchus oxyrinchus]|uniref:Cyclin-dependent kinase 4 inhibitor B-like n=1 Tax=Acipenser oxyrinchus oxyrinchus TaxID=40147 RepID=A0AAD8GKQ3_ACIOX|nr:cyclin-dependent kinase 4 inhibitor B-like [Acipenser oxyrinchus oxyrinchus]
MNADILTKAAATGDTDRVRILLENGINPNAVNRFGKTPIQVMMMGNTRIAELLLMHGANPNIVDSSTGLTPIHDAAREGFLDTVGMLVRNNANTNVRDRRNLLPLDLAKENGHEEVLAYLKSLE